MSITIIKMVDLDKVFRWTVSEGCGWVRNTHFRLDYYRTIPTLAKSHLHILDSGSHHLIFVDFTVFKFLFSVRFLHFFIFFYISPNGSFKQVKIADLSIKRLSITVCTDPLPISIATVPTSSLSLVVKFVTCMKLMKSLFFSLPLTVLVLSMLSWRM